MMFKRCSNLRAVSYRHRNTSFFLFISLFSVLTLSCFDPVELTPPCFQEVNNPRTSNVKVVETNVCCEEGASGDQFCGEFFAEQGYVALTPLAYCTEDSTCRLCEIDVNCQCLNNRDCSDSQSCRVIDDRERCQEVLGLEDSRRCAICVEDE